MNELTMITDRLSVYWQSEYSIEIISSQNIDKNIGEGRVWELGTLFISIAVFYDRYIMPIKDLLRNFYVNQALLLSTKLGLLESLMADGKCNLLKYIPRKPLVQWINHITITQSYLNYNLICFLNSSRKSF